MVPVETVASGITWMVKERKTGSDTLAASGAPGMPGSTRLKLKARSGRMPPVIGLTVQPGVDSSVLMTGIWATMLPTLGVK